MRKHSVVLFSLLLLAALGCLLLSGCCAPSLAGPALAVTITGNETELDLSAVDAEYINQLIPNIAEMPNLKSIDLGDAGDAAAPRIPWETVKAIEEARPDVTVRYKFVLFGKPCELQDTAVDLNHLEMFDEGALVKKVALCMPQLTWLDMDFCGVSDEAMADIRDSLPNAQVVWRVWFGKGIHGGYSVRTDVTRILASNPDKAGELNPETTKSLKYCTKVKYLDLGHNDEMSDLSFAMYMPDLEVLIIAMTGVSDLSPLTNCSKLEYLELNSSPHVSDLSPLEGHTALRHLNIGCCPEIRDISPLYGISELERLWIGCETPVPAEQVAQMRQAAPGCKINTTTSDPHGEAWRFTRYDPEEPKYYWVPRHELLRNQLGYNYQEYSFYWLDPLCDLPAPPEHAGKYGKGVYGL
jgi:hypothetical protein